MEPTPFMLRLAAALGAADLAAGTIRRTLIDARQFEGWLRDTTGHGLDPDDIKIAAADLVEYRSCLRRRDMTPGTIRRKFASIRKSLMLLAPGVALGITWPRLPTEAPGAPSGFTRSERNAIIRAAERLSPRDACVIHLLLNTGCRASSLANLRLGDVVVGARAGSVTFRHAKNDRTYVCPLNHAARVAVTRYLEVRPAVSDHDRLLCAERFPHPPISRAVIWRIWHERMRRHLPAGVAGRVRGPHQARHDLARRLLSGDGGLRPPTPLQDVARILGHAGGDPRITAGVYGAPSGDDLRRALDDIVDDDGEG